VQRMDGIKRRTKSRMAPSMPDAFLSHAHFKAGSRVGRGLAGGGSSVFGMSGSNACGAQKRTCESVIRMTPGRRSGLIRNIALLGALVLGLGSISRVLAARAEEAAPSGTQRALAAPRVEPGDARPGGRLGHRHWHKRSPKTPWAVSTNDPNDDGTAPDPDDDDDTSEDLNCDDDTNAPVVAYVSGVVLYMIGSDREPVASPREANSPLFLLLKRLRC
jgi:hypothetical protein